MTAVVSMILSRKDPLSKEKGVGTHLLLGGMGAAMLCVGGHSCHRFGCWGRTVAGYLPR